MDKNNSYLIISIILGFLITIFYIHNFDIIFLGNFILISFVIYILFYYLGNKEFSENFENNSEEDNNIEENNNDTEENNNNTEEEIDFEEGYNEAEEEIDFEESYDSEEEILKEETFAEQMEEQEEHVKQAQEMEEYQEELLQKMEEQEEEEIKKSSKENDGYMKKIMDNINNIKTGINSGIGVGISPVNINLSCGAKVDDNSSPSVKPNRPRHKRCPDVNKQSSRIHNNSDWIYDNPYWKNQDESYNYNNQEDKNSGKLSPCSKGNNDDYLLPCIQPEANKIPQTLNNLMNKRKSKENDVCPMEINMPWSNYKTGDDKESNKILEGYSF